MLEIIILVIFVFWLGYQLGIAVQLYRLRHLIFYEAKRMGLTTKADEKLFEEEKPKATKPTVVQLCVEKANNILYLYERDTGNFVCQGSTLDELAKLAQKYKNIKYASVKTDEDVYAFVDGTVKTAKEVLK